MYGNVNTPIKRGQTYYGGNVPASTYWKETVDIEGLEATFEDVAPATARGQVLTKRSGLPVRCRLVRNVTAGETALLPQKVVTYASGYRLKRIVGMVCVGDTECAGVVDEHLPAAGVLYGDLFWIVVDGQTLVSRGLESNVITAGDRLLGQTAATTNAATAGAVYSYAATDNVTNIAAQMLNRVGWAVSAKTTGQTTTHGGMLAQIKIF